ncbi:MAG: TolC family protein, partial [Bryobacteraceae bacterium]|nr:TolC family protein [Bryobacteraceae bacterium]
ELQEQRQLNGVRLEVQNAQIAVEQARAQYQAAVKNRILQEKTLDAEQKKYALGSSTIFFVVQAQRDLALAQQSEVQAMTSYTRARNQMYVASGNLLESYQISLPEAQAGSVARPADLPVDPAK